MLQTSSIKASAEPTSGSGSGPRIALFLEEESGDWHVRRLAKAMRNRGATVVISSLPRCAFDTGLASGIDMDTYRTELFERMSVQFVRKRDPEREEEKARRGPKKGRRTRTHMEPASK